MKFEEIVELVEEIEEKFSTLTNAQLGLVEAILEEGMDREFDVVHHLDYFVEFASAFSDANAEIISESVDCGEVLDEILSSARKNPRNISKFVTEAIASVGELDTLIDETDNSTQVTLLSIVSTVLTEMLGEEAVEALPAEMVFDIAEEAKYLDVSDSLSEMTLPERVAEISDALKEAISNGEIDFETEDYMCETFADFLNDYEDTSDLLEEMSKVTDELLSEAVDEDAARLMEKAKAATALLEGRCTPGDLECMLKKAKAAKTWFSKSKNAAKWTKRNGGAKPHEMDKWEGKLGTAVNKSIKNFKSRYKKNPSGDLVKYVWVPGIIKRMKAKGRSMSAGSKKLQKGQHAIG